MADGHRLPLQEYFRIPNLTSSYQYNHVAHHGPYGVVESVGLKAGVLANRQPVSENVQYFNGQKQFSYVDDFYNHIYLIPETLNFGSVTSTMTMDVYVWNAYLRENTLSSIVETNGSGVAISGPSLPAHFNRLQGRIYTVTASTEGPAYIDARYTFNFDGLDRTPPVLPVFGSRAELWKLRPNWANRYNMSYAYSTDIFESRAGKEQRRALRSTPRLQIEFEALAHANTLRWYNNTMVGWQRNAFLMPEFTRSITATNNMPAGSRQITVDSVPSWLVAGASVVLVRADQSEARLVDRVEGNTLTFTSIGRADWKAGSAIHPGLGGHIAQEMSSNRPTSEVGVISVQFTENPGDGIPLPLPPAELTYNGIEVNLLKPNWGAGVRTDHLWPIEQVDFNRGRIKNFSYRPFGNRTFQAEYLRIGRDQAQAILDLFRRMKGRRGSFYMPTMDNDLPPMDGLQAGGSRLRVAGTDVERMMQNRSTHKHIVAFTDVGIFFNKVVLFETVNDERGEDSLLTVETAWPVAVTADKVQKVCWLPQWRFSSDTLTLSWLTDEVASVTTAFTLLEDLT